jgi:hypothetical protein
MDRLYGISRQSPVTRRVSGRHRQCKKRYFWAGLQGDGDRGRLSASSDSRKQQIVTSPKKIACPILSSQIHRYLLLTRRSGPNRPSFDSVIGYQ